MSDQAATAPPTAPASFWRPQNRRREPIAKELTVLIVLFLLFLTVIEALIRETLKPEVLTLIGGFGGTILTMIGVIVNYMWGSSKGSAMKDQLLAMPDQPPSSQTQTGVR